MRERPVNAYSMRRPGFFIHAACVRWVSTRSSRTRARRSPLFTGHFPAKDDLILAYLNRADQVWTGQLHAAAGAAGPDPGRQLVGLFDALESVRGHDSFRGCAFINAAAEAGPGTPAHGRALAHKRQVLGWISDLARRAGADEPDRLARTLTLLLDGALASGAQDDGAAAAREAARLLVRVSLRRHQSSHAGIASRIRCDGPNQVRHDAG